MTGFTIWLTGLSGAGKTTIANLVEQELRGKDFQVEHLEGDVVRKGLCRDLGFIGRDRDTNIERVSFVAKLLTRNGVIVICDFISPYKEHRERARREIGEFIEVHIECPLTICIQRDVKGLYAKALLGKIKNFTGISDPYDTPRFPELVCNTSSCTPEESAMQVIKYLEDYEYIPTDGFLRHSLGSRPS